MEDVNPYARNLILVSVAFILYALLGLAPAESNGSAEINLLFMSFEITRPELLPWLAYVLLGYTIWKFEVTLPEYAPRDKAMNLSARLHQQVDRTLRAAVKDSSTRLHNMLVSAAWAAYKREPKTDNRAPNEGIRGSYSRDGAHLLEFNKNTVEVNSSVRATVFCSVAPTELIGERRLSNDELNKVDGFTFKINAGTGWFVFGLSYLKFVGTTSYFHSLVVPRVLYALAISAALILRVA